MPMPMIRHKSRDIRHNRVHRVQTIQIMQMHPGNSGHIMRVSVQKRCKTLQERQQNNKGETVDPEHGRILNRG